VSATSVIWEGETTIRGIVRHVRLLSDGSTEDWRTVSLGAKEYETWCGGAWWPYVARQIVADLQRAQADLATAYIRIRDIDAHATPYGEGEYAQLYIISAGSLHRALALTGAAAKCATLPCERAEKAERELERANGLLRRTKPYVSTWPNTEPLRLAVEAHLRGEFTNRTAPATTNERALWIEYAALLTKNINELAGLHVAHGVTKLTSDEDIARGKELRRLLGIEGDETAKGGTE
jgi:hypothetical protein